ncbi:MAG TPA: putative Ig domain-containing protein, partial [Planctomycetota bacterium]|nr:putative Ig domain-containing protein [Planctomycetota bacterium]
TDDERYIDLEFDTAGTWYVLRGDGKVFTSANLNVPLVDLPGDASDPEGDDTFVDLTTNGTDFWAVRFDGRLFKNTDGIEIVNLDSDRYRRIAVSTTPPDLSSFVNALPVTATYKTTVLAGAPVLIPVVSTDSDKRAVDLVVNFPSLAEQPANFPPGFAFVPSGGATSARGALVGNAPAEPGGYSMILFVDDGSGTAPKKLTYKLKVVLPDTDPLKDKKPVFAKPKKPQVVVTGAPPAEVLLLPIFAVDADGDPITLSVDPKTPLPAGAIFDPGTGFLTWVAAPEQAGKTRIRFLATAGTRTVKLKVELTVVNGLIF